MAYPPAAVESATTAHVPDFTGAFEAYSTTSLLLACARSPLVIIPTIHAMLLNRTPKRHLVKLGICAPSPWFGETYRIEFVRRSEVASHDYCCPITRGRDYERSVFISESEQRFLGHKSQLEAQLCFAKTERWVGQMTKIARRIMTRSQIQNLALRKYSVVRADHAED